MQRLVVCLLACSLLLGGWLFAAESRAYERPIETVWEHALKASRDVDFVLLDSNHSEYWFTMRTKSKLSSKRGMVMAVTLSGDHTHATIEVSAVDPAKAQKLAKHIRNFMIAVDKRLS